MVKSPSLPLVPAPPGLRRHYAMWMFTAACPSRCTYCDLDSQKRLGSLDEGEVVATARAILDNGFREVMFAGGEALLSPHLPAALAVLRGRVQTAVFSGGLPGLAERSVEVLREGGVTRVVCSIDSGDDARNDEIRGRAGITAALTGFAALLHERLPRLSRSINTVVSRFNVETVGDVWERLRAYRFDVWALTLAGDFFEASPGHALIEPEALQRFYFETVPALARRVGSDGGKLVVLPIPFPLLAAGLPPQRWDSLPDALREAILPELVLFSRGEFNRTFVERCGCPLPGQDIVIGVGGQIHPCSQAPIIHPSYVVGNVKQAPLADILAGDALQTFAAGVPHRPCKRCWAPSNIPPEVLRERLLDWQSRAAGSTTTANIATSANIATPPNTVTITKLATTSNATITAMPRTAAEPAS